MGFQHPAKILYMPKVKLFLSDNTSTNISIKHINELGELLGPMFSSCDNLIGEPLEQKVTLLMKLIA